MFLQLGDGGGGESRVPPRRPNQRRRWRAGCGVWGGEGRGGEQPGGQPGRDTDLLGRDGGAWEKRGRTGGGLGGMSAGCRDLV